MIQWDRNVCGVAPEVAGAGAFAGMSMMIQKQRTEMGDGWRAEQRLIIQVNQASRSSWKRLRLLEASVGGAWFAKLCERLVAYISATRADWLDPLLPQSHPLPRVASNSPNEFS
ncbi:uncharacterized protein MYCFIDRAFT_173953 [Pseudocercospora fijiensis CIRAD86]|uniref:Uncharacterized protein n=1 Tax=Pseudocercospora fijiensis (strain CIRAD86) TaxID=383855 RepID=M2Z5J7_PSEFD|nr:uncharacterized protein MYCFIDRAFT_173953 [Pseudocercospora fijiensis CIRAD86]EME85090.1 hypothetical protein MYCFIDRAFT_173953 [Pseudocercospora fijiensis CIRAD86]